MTRIQLFIWSTIINAIFSYAMVALVLFSRPVTRIKATWAAMCFVTGTWSLGLGWMSASNDFSSALMGSQIVTGFSIFIPTFFYHTVHALLKRTSKYPLFIFYTLSLLLSLLNLNGNLMTVRPALDFPFYTTAKPAYSLFMLHLYGCFIYSGWSLWKESLKSLRLIRNQLRSLFWGAFWGFLGGQMTVPLVYGIPIFPYGVFFVPLYILFVGNGMLKYQFMDFKLALRKLGLTVAIYFLLILLIAPVSWPFIKTIINQPISAINQTIALSSIITVLIATGPLIYALILQRTYWLRGHSTMALAHELKSPLLNIRGAIEYLSTQIPKLPGNTTSLQEYNGILSRNTDRLESFVENLLNIAAIQEGEINLNFTEFSFSETAKTVATHFSPAANKKGIYIEVKNIGESNIYADQARIEQVLSNLVSNAIKFSKNGVIQIDISLRDRELMCSVMDQGEGIALENLSRIFDRFYQGKKAPSGSGIGLTIAKAWVEAHQGKIWAESRGIRQGTTIIFTLPQT